MSLNQEELTYLADLLERAESKQITGHVWKALVKKFPTVPIELVILNSKNEVFLVYRDDDEFKGWHFPGSVWNDWETLPERREKLVAGEILRDAEISITPPKSIGWMGVHRTGDGYTGYTRNSCALMHLAYVVGDPALKETHGFFSFEALPEDTLSHHKFMLKRVKQYLSDRIPLSD